MGDSAEKESCYENLDCNSEKKSGGLLIFTSDCSADSLEAGTAGENGSLYVLILMQT